MMTVARSDLVSVIIPVGSRHSDIAALHADYRAGLAAAGHACEFIYVLDGPNPAIADQLRGLGAAGEPITVLSLGRRFGEATALMVGFERCSGDRILTLPAYAQVDARDIGALVDALGESDVVVSHRTPRAGNWFERLRRTAFHNLLAWNTGLRFNDLGCGARAIRRRVLEEIQIYGDQHRFLAVLADRHGFRVREVPVRQSPLDRRTGVYRPREYARGFIDIFTVFFLVRFTKKPLRFFGMLGVSTFLVGALIVLWLVADRLFFGHSLAARPALLLASLLVVLGFQLFALGLLGELMIFTHAGQIKDYRVETIVGGEQDHGRDGSGHH